MGQMTSRHAPPYYDLPQSFITVQLSVSDHQLTEWYCFQNMTSNTAQSLYFSCPCLEWYISSAGVWLSNHINFIFSHNKMAALHRTSSLPHFKRSRCLGSNRLLLAQIFHATASKNSLVVAPFKQSLQQTKNQMFSSLVSYIPYLFAVVCIRCFFCFDFFLLAEPDQRKIIMETEGGRSKTKVPPRYPLQL